MKTLYAKIIIGFLNIKFMILKVSLFFKYLIKSWLWVFLGDFGKFGICRKFGVAGKFGVVFNYVRVKAGFRPAECSMICI